MAKYKLSFKQSVAKDLRRIPNQDVKNILKRINALTQDPRPVGCEKLSGEERYRVRQGGFRIVYEIDDEIVTIIVVKVAHRRDVYR